MNLPKRSSFKSVLKVYTLSKKFYFGLSLVHIFQKMCATPGACIKPGCLARRPLYHKVNLPASWEAQRLLCHKVNLPRCEARRHHFTMTCDIFGTGQTNILAVCYLFGKKRDQPTVAPLKPLKSIHSTKLLDKLLT